MQMIHRLPAVVAGVDDHAVALAEALVASDLRCSPEKVAEQGGVMCASFGEGDDVLARRDEDVHRRLRIDVGEGIALLVFIDRGGRNTSLDDFAEKATHDGTSVQDRKQKLGAATLATDRKFCVAGHSQVLPFLFCSTEGTPWIYLN